MDYSSNLLDNASNTLVIFMEQKMIIFLAIAVAVGLAAGAGIGYLVFDDDEPTDETYWFYLYFADGDSRNKWYSATGSDATKAFDNAMDAAGYEWEKSNWGYISSIDGVGSSWAAYNYLWDCYSEDACESSIANDVYSAYGTFVSSNGWKEFSGFDDDGSDKMKLYQSNSNVFIFTTYDSYWNPLIDPKTGYDCWDDSGPFAD